MVNYDFNLLTNGQQIAFNGTGTPPVDVLAMVGIDGSAIVLTQSGANVTVTANGKTVTLLATTIGQLTTGNLVLSNGSVVQIGDNTSNDGLDELGNVINIGANNNNNQVLGLGGGDTITVGNGNNRIVGGSGNDTFLLGATTGDNTVFGGDGVAHAADGNDTATFNTGSFLFYGAGGNDNVTAAPILAGKTGTYFGGQGNDSITSGAAAGDLNITLGLGIDTANLATSTGAFTIIGGNGTADTADGADAVTTGGGNGSVFTNAGNDTVVLNAINNATQNVFTGLGNDSVNAASAGATTTNLVITAGLGADVVNLTNGGLFAGGANFAGAATIFGGQGTVDTGDGNDTILAGAGNRTVYGNAGDDSVTITTNGTNTGRVFGGAGNDTIIVTPGAATALITVDGGLGNDTFNVSFGNNAAVNINGFLTGTDVVNVTLQGGDASTLQVGRGGSSTSVQNSGGNTEALVFTNFLGNFTATNFVINGGSRLLTNFDGTATTLTGTANNDQLIAGGNGDRLVALAGNDVLLGGAGVDTAAFLAANWANTDTVNGGAGNDIVEFSTPGAVADATWANKTSLEQINLSNENWAGSAVTLAGNALAAGLTTVNAGGLTGANGSQIVAGGFANALTFTGGNGVDTVTTGGGADSITGAGGNDVLVGGAGIDTIHGGGNDDQITGGDGADNLTGGTENDDFIYTVLATQVGDTITDFDAATNATTVDQFSFVDDAAQFDLGNTNNTVNAFTTVAAIVDAGVAAAEIIVLRTVGIATADITTSLNTINTTVTAGEGLLNLFFNTTLGHAQIWHDANGGTAGGHTLIANLTNITTVAGMDNFDAGDFIFT